MHKYNINIQIYKYIKLQIQLESNSIVRFISGELLPKSEILAQAALTRYHRLGGLNNRNLFSHHSRS